MLGIDPGHKKCGVALVAADGCVQRQAVVPAEQLGETLAAWLTAADVTHVVVGNGTRSRAVQELAASLAGAERVAVRDETGTTLEARGRYWREHPPRGLWRLIPTTMRVPPVPFDDLVAAILADRLHAELAGQDS